MCIAILPESAAAPTGLRRAPWVTRGTVALRHAGVPGSVAAGAVSGGGPGQREPRSSSVRRRRHRRQAAASVGILKVSSWCSNPATFAMSVALQFVVVDHRVPPAIPAARPRLPAERPEQAERAAEGLAPHVLARVIDEGALPGAVLRVPDEVAVDVHGSVPSLVALLLDQRGFEVVVVGPHGRDPPRPLLPRQRARRACESRGRVVHPARLPDAEVVHPALLLAVVDRVRALQVLLEPPKVRRHGSHSVGADPRRVLERDALPAHVRVRVAGPILRRELGVLPVAAPLPVGHGLALGLAVGAEARPADVQLAVPAPEVVVVSSFHRGPPPYV